MMPVNLRPTRVLVEVARAMALVMAAVMRMLWRQENGAWRITSYAVEMP